MCIRDSAWGVALSPDGNTAYVADDQAGLQIIDLVATEFSVVTGTVSITVDPVNDQPVLVDASLSLDAISEDPGVPSGAVGTLVSSLIDTDGGLNNFSDEDGDAPGIAITEVDLGGGTLYYSLDNGTSWSDVGTVSADSARVLYADSDLSLIHI